MDSRKIVFKETGIVALGVAVLTGLMIGVFAMLGYYKTDVLLGGIVGALIAVCNFFVMAVIATLAGDKAQAGEPQAGQKLIKGSYPVRILVLGVLLFACAKSGWFNVVALVLPLVFVRPTITIAEFFRKKGA